MSETKNLGLFKHDNPATNTNRFDVDKAINQNLDKIDNAVGQDRERISLLETSNTIYNYKGKADTLATIKSKTSKQGDVWYCIEDSTYYAYNGTDWIPVNLNLKLGVIDDLQTKIIKVIQEVETPTPVTGTKINIKDSVEAKITEFNISGNHKQETREGYNVLDISKYAYSESESTLNAGTVTVKDGIITLNATNATNLMTARSNSVQADNRKVIPAGTYYFGVNCNLYPKNGGTLLQAKIGVQTLAEDYYLSQWYITCEKNKTDSFKLLISNDTNKTDYEPYGVMPSPNYSSEVKTVGDNINLYNYEIANEHTNGLSEQINNDGSFTATGTATTTWANLSKNNSLATELKKGEQYIIQHEEITKAINIMFSNDSAEQKVAIKGSKNVTFTANINITKARVYVEGLTSGSSYKITDRIHITKGTTPKPYSLYNQGSTEIIKCNKNIFKMKDKYFTTKGRNQYQCLYLKSYTDNSVTVWTQYGGTYQFAYIIIPNLKPNTSYSLRYDLTKNETTYSPNMLLQNGKKTDSNGNLEIMINLGNNANASIAGKNIVFDNIQIKEGATMAPYVNHQEEIYNIPIQQEMLEEDKFDWDNKKEVHNWGKLILTGNESYAMYTENNINIFHNSVDTIESVDYCKVYSTHFIYANTYSELVSGNGKIAIRSQGKKIYFTANFATVDEFKTFLQTQYNAGTPVIVYYKLKTPTQLAFITQQKEVAKQIKQAKTYDGVTNIYSEDEVSPNIEITYKKDIETLFANTLVESGV